MLDPQNWLGLEVFWPHNKKPFVTYNWGPNVMGNHEHWCIKGDSNPITWEATQRMWRIINGKIKYWKWGFILAFELYQDII